MEALRPIDLDQEQSQAFADYFYETLSLSRKKHSARSDGFLAIGGCKQIFEGVRQWRIPIKFEKVIKCDCVSIIKFSEILELRVRSSTSHIYGKECKHMGVC